MAIFSDRWLVMCKKGRAWVRQGAFPLWIPNRSQNGKAHIFRELHGAGKSLLFDKFPKKLYR
jgi:hypothetical protein